MAEERVDEFVSIEMVEKQVLPRPRSIRKAWQHCIVLALCGGGIGVGIAYTAGTEPALAGLLSWGLTLLVSLNVYNFWLWKHYRLSMLSRDV